MGDYDRSNDHISRRLIAAIPAAIYTTDARGKITYFNQAVAELVGRPPTIDSDEWCVTWKLYDPNGTPLPYDQCRWRSLLERVVPSATLK